MKAEEKELVRKVYIRTFKQLSEENPQLLRIKVTEQKLKPVKVIIKTKEI